MAFGAIFPPLKRGFSPPVIVAVPVFVLHGLARYVDLTSRCSEMMTDVVGYVLARNCERPASETRAFLNPARLPCELLGARGGRLRVPVAQQLRGLHRPPSII